MKELSFSAVQQLQFIHDFPAVGRFVDTSDSPMWEIWKELLDGEYIFECQGYAQCGDELIEAGAGYDITPAGNAYLLEFSKSLERKNVSEIYLNGREYRILKKIRKSDDYEVDSKDIPPLVQAGVVNFRYKEAPERDGGCVPVCNITNTGERYLSFRKEEARKTWVPVIISLLALVVSVCAYFKAA